MKKVLALLLVLALAVVSGAEAARRNFGGISADVPEGWIVEDSDEQIAFSAPDESAFVTIVAHPMEGMSLEEFAQGTAEGLGGKAQKSGNGYGFSFYDEDSRLDCEAMVVEKKSVGVFLIIVAGGEHDDLESLISSIELAQ
jgi:hypothetical protein